MIGRMSLSVALVVVCATCDAPVTPADCVTPRNIETYSKGYEVGRKICIESPDATPPYETRSSDMDVATVTTAGSRLLVTGGNKGEATITVTSANSDGMAGTEVYSVTTLDPWTLESFECTVADDPDNPGFWAVNYGAVVGAEVDLAELTLLVFIDELRFGPATTIEHLLKDQQAEVTAGGATSKSSRDIDLNDYECTMTAEWVYAP